MHSNFDVHHFYVVVSLSWSKLYVGGLIRGNCFTLLGWLDVEGFDWHICQDYSNIFAKTTVSVFLSASALGDKVSPDYTIHKQ